MYICSSNVPRVSYPQKAKQPSETIFSDVYEEEHCSGNTSELDATENALEYGARIDERERPLLKRFKQSTTIFMVMIVNEKYRKEAA